MTSAREYPVVIVPGSKDQLYHVLAAAAASAGESDISAVLYTCSVPYLTGSGSTMTLHAGASKAGPVVGACRISMVSRDIKLAFGDPADDANVVWEELRHESFFKINHKSLSVQMPLTGERQEFEWRGTHEVKGFWKKVDGYHLKLVDKATGDLVARFIHDLESRSTCGVFEMKRDLGGDEWDRIVILSGLGMLQFLKLSTIMFPVV